MEIFDDIYKKIMDIGLWKTSLHKNLEEMQELLEKLPPSEEVDQLKKKLNWMRDQFNTHNMSRPA